MCTIAEADKLFAAKKWAEAIDAYKNCIASGLVVSTEQKTNAYFSVGYAFDELKEWDKAVEWYSKAIELNPRDSPALFNRGLLYQQRREYASALADFSLLLTITPNQKSCPICTFNALKYIVF